MRRSIGYSLAISAMVWTAFYVNLDLSMRLLASDACQRGNTEACRVIRTKAK
jgi:hypothetical protein